MGSSRWGPSFPHVNPSQDTSYPNPDAAEAGGALGVLIQRSHCVRPSSLGCFLHIFCSSTVWLNKPLLLIGHTSLRPKHLLLTSLQCLCLWKGAVRIYHGTEFIRSSKKCLLHSSCLLSQFTIPGALWSRRSQGSQVRHMYRGLGQS